MGGQEELSGLDADVAAGRISTEEYRSRRDELHSRPDAGAVDANPFPPPFRWVEAHRAGTAPSSYIPVVTTAVPTPTGAHASGDADSTQRVRAGASSPVPSTRASTQSSKPDGTSPPWHRDQEFTPRPGSDPFDQFRTRGPRSWVKPTVAAVVAVAVIALVVVVLVVLLVRDGSSTSAAPTTPAPSIASLPGNQLLDTKFATLADLQRAKVLSTDELAALEPARPLDTHLRVNQDGSTTTIVWTCTVDGDASAVVSRLITRSAGSGFVPVRPFLPDVAALQQLPAAGKAGPAALRASYVNGDTVVHVESRGPHPAAAGGAFRSALDAELAALPAR